MPALEERLFADSGLRRVIANSRQVKEEIIRHYRRYPQRLAVIYNGLDRRRFRPRKSPGERPCGPGWGRRPAPSRYLPVRVWSQRFDLSPRGLWRSAA